MKEYVLAQNGSTEFLVLKLIDNIYRVIAKSGSRDYAEQIVDALTPAAEIRTTWSDLESIAHERGR